MYGNDLKSVILLQILMINTVRISYKTALKWMPYEIHRW